VATDQKPTPEPTKQETTWRDKLRGRGADQAAKARAALAVQRDHAKARTGDWLKGADLTDEDLQQMVTEKAREHRAQRVAEAEQQVAILENRLDMARSMGKRGKDMVSQLKMQLVVAEDALDAVASEPDPPPTQRQLNSARLKKRATRAGYLVGGGLLALKGAATDPTLLGFLGVAGGYGWYLVSRPFTDGQTPAPAPSTPQGLATPQSPAPSINLTKPEPAPGVREFNAPPPPALTVSQLDEALRSVGMVRPGEKIQILAVPQREKDGNTTVVFDLPAGQKVANLQLKIEEFAGALGRDSTMVDIEKAGSAVRTSLWITDEDPFANTRPSPLITHPTQIDAFRDGIPVGWGKRGNTIKLPISSSNIVIGGGARSGKGVGASNLAVGATFDPRINPRIVAGKQNAEWDAYARAGIACTYFKPDPARLLALLDAEIADKDRREAALGRLGKSKLVGPAIEQLGGIELIIIDELATYTRPGKPLRDEILERLVLLASVAPAAGILLVVLTQYPGVDIFPTELAVNFTTKWAMRVDTATQSNAILGAGSSGMGRDASKFDPPRPGLGWLVNPFVGVTDRARSFDIDEDERGEISMLQEKAAKIREAAGRLAGQWDDPIERHLLNATGLSSAAGGPKRDGIPGRNVLNHTPDQKFQIGCCRQALEAMDQLGRDVAQLDEMAQIIGAIQSDELGRALRSAGAGGTVKITVPGREGQVRGYQRADVKDALDLLLGS